MIASDSKPLPLGAALQQAVDHHQAGRLQEAEQLYRTILQAQPGQPAANHNLGVLAVQVGQHAAGLPYLKAALEAHPAKEQYWLSYAEALLATGHASEALKTLQTAIQRGLKTPAIKALRKKTEAALANIAAKGAAPTPAEINQLAALYNAGRYAELENRGRILVEQYPVSGVAWKVLGLSLQVQGKMALPALQKAAELLPDDAEAYNNLGITRQALGQHTDAVACYRRALEIKPDFADARYNLGVALQNLGQLDEAVASYRHALTIKPDCADAHSNLGVALQKLGQLDEAVASYRRALEINPDHLDAYSNLGVALQDLGQLDEAVSSYRRALTIKSDCVDVHNNLGITLQKLGQLNEAVASYRRALTIKPDFAAAHSNLGNALQALGQYDGAVASFRRALTIKPDGDGAYIGLLFLYSYHALIDPDEYLAHARDWEQSCVPAPDRQAARRRVFRHPPLTGRRLKVGYVSGDYRQHAMSYFVEQLFAHHDRTRIELFAYSTQGKRDAVTERLQALAEHWIPLAGMTDAAIRERIEADGIDVLIDLSGHTAHNRLGVFARRAAPVQAHYLGFMSSTGLTEMDYWIGDEILTPVETDSHFSERVWRLPRVWVSYDGKTAPLSNWHPSQGGTVWLGSFNNLGKLTPATLALWAKVLHALPEGKMLLKNKELACAGNRQRILDVMDSHGIAPDRIELQDSSATSDWSAHMAYYDRLDIALDPVGGMGGGTTTCDALWMGVPVITLEGDRMASRMTASMLDAIGQPDWIAHSEAEYIGKVVTLARDEVRRETLRPHQRSRMAASPLCDVHGLAFALENAYFEMFERWLSEKN